MTGARWEHFDHGADIGVRGYGETLAAAFEQAALALSAVVADIGEIGETEEVRIACSADDPEELLLAWLNDVVYEMAVNRMLFRSYDVVIDGGRLNATVRGETVDPSRHHPVVEVKGATYTQLEVRRLEDGFWMAQTVVDV